jgi:hypothetical protein
VTTLADSLDVWYKGWIPGKKCVKVENSSLLPGTILLNIEQVLLFSYCVILLLYEDMTFGQYQKSKMATIWLIFMNK